MPIHASTQMTITNALGARFLEEQGVERVVTARELQLEEIKNIREKTAIRVNAYIAVCLEGEVEIAVSVHSLADCRIK